MLTRSISFAIERKRAYELHHSRDENHRALFEEFRDTIFVGGPEGEIVDVKQAALDLFASTRKQALSSNVGEKVSPGDNQW